MDAAARLAIVTGFFTSAEADLPVDAFAIDGFELPDATFTAGADQAMVRTDKNGILDTDKDHGARIVGPK